jgi:ligand-binding sensor domain-containing protein
VGTDYGLVKFNKTNNLLTLLYKPYNSNKDNIQEMIEDKEGNIWIISRTGLFENNLLRYSKSGNWATFETPHNNISALRPAKNDGVLFASYKSIFLFNGSTLKELEIGSLYSSFFNIFDVIADNNQINWVSTTEGLYKTDIENQEKELIKSMNCTSLAIDSLNNLWIASSDSGLYKLENNVFVNYNTTNSGLPSNNITSLKFDLSGNLWLNTHNGLVRYNGSEWKTYEMVSSYIPGKEILNFVTDQNAINFIWNGDLIRFDGNNTDKYKIGDVKTTLASEYITSLAFDKKDNLWIANNGPVLQCMKNDVWVNYTLSDTLKLDSVFSRIYTDSSSCLWKGEGIIIKHDAGKGYYRWYVYNTENRHRGNKIIIDASNSIWEAAGKGNGSGKGIFKYVNGNKITFNSTNSPLPTNEISHLVFDKNEKLLVTTTPVVNDEKGRLLSFDGNSCDTIYTVYEDFTKISPMIFDNDGSLWLGVTSLSPISRERGAGVYVFNGNTATNYSIWNSPISSNSVVSLNIDHKNNLWVGSYVGGLDKFDRVGQWTNFNSQNSPIGFNSIENIEVNSLGSLAVSVQFYGFVYIPSDMEVGISPGLTYPENSEIFLTIFPNPVKNDLYLSLSATEDVNIQASLFDMIGRLIISFPNEKLSNGNQSLHYNLGGRLKANQIYILNVKVNNNQYRKKIVYNGL